MTEAEKMTMWHDWCKILEARDIRDNTSWDQMVKCGHMIQWAVTGTLAKDNKGWVQDQLRAWGFSDTKSPATDGLTSEDAMTEEPMPMLVVNLSARDHIPQEPVHAGMSLYDAGKDIWDMVDFEKDEK